MTDTRWEEYKQDLFSKGKGKGVEDVGLDSQP
jgi:hypothetical protein